jgi:hypothetical protein
MIMLSLTIARLQRIIPKLMVLQRGWFRHARRDFERFCFTGNKEDWDLALPYIAMGYKMSKHTYLSHFAFYFLFFRKHPIPPFSIVVQTNQVMDLDTPTIRAKSSQ